jgi:hypothetical protein
MRIELPVMVWIIVVAAVVWAEQDTDSDAIRATNKIVVAAWDKGNTELSADDANVMLRPGLMADRRSQRVEFFAEATGITTNEAMEFFLISETSGNGYEAYAVALARPRDIYDALQFIGMQPGNGIDFERLRFWPKGERVIITIDGVRAESLIYNSDTQRPMDPSGLIFIGSRLIPNSANTNETVLTAQAREPNSIAANYNEPDSLFDVPFSAPQTAVYSKQSLHHDHVAPAGKLMRVMIEPEYKDGRKRVQEMTLQVHASTNDSPALADTPLSICRQNGEFILQHAKLPAVLERFSTMNDGGEDPFVAVAYDGGTTIRQLHDFATVLRAIDTEKGIRVEPPPKGMLYYKAFTPNEVFRERKNRYLQPWELRLHPTADGSVTGVVTDVTERWPDGATKPTIETRDTAVASPDALRDHITSRKPDIRAILVFAPPTLTYDQLMSYVGPVYETHPMVHVFMEPQPGPTPANDG